MLDLEHRLIAYMTDPAISENIPGCISQVPAFLQRFSEAHSLSFEEMFLSYICALPIVTTSKYGRDFSLSLIDDSKFSFVKSLLHKLGIRFDDENLEYFESVLILHMEDPDNPSLTRLIDSYAAESRLLNALEEAIDEHRKPLHHGAGAEALKMIIQLSHASDIEEALNQRIRTGELVFGLGHRIYTTIDPRAEYIQKILRVRCKKVKMEWLIDVITDIAEMAPCLIEEIKGTEVHPNVDLYNAAFYHTYGLPAEANTDLFAVARAAGWMAHLLEA